MWWTVTGVVGAAGVVAGAFGAHALREIDPDLLTIWDTAARYHLAHAAALGLVAAHPGRPRVAGALFLVGIAVFSGSLYLLALTGIRWLGAITPIGGISLIAGWLALALAPRPRSGADHSTS